MSHLWLMGAPYGGSVVSCTKNLIASCNITQVSPKPGAKTVEPQSTEVLTTPKHAPVNDATDQPKRTTGDQP
jgi:hypothetical protein